MKWKPAPTLSCLSKGHGKGVGLPKSGRLEMEETGHELWAGGLKGKGGYEGRTGVLKNKMATKGHGPGVANTTLLSIEGRLGSAGLGPLGWSNPTAMKKVQRKGRPRERPKSLSTRCGGSEVCFEEKQTRKDE